MLKLTGIHKEYQAGDMVVEALHGVDVELRQNEFVAILGPSGCGKTTLLNIVGGLDRYTSGDLSVNGRSTKNFSDADWDAYRNRSVGFVFQNYNLIPHQSVLSNVELALTLSGVTKAERRARAEAALHKVGLTDQLKKKPSQMSGGQMQRVAIARALVNDPEILLADEPTGALDSETSEQIMGLLAEVAKDRLVVMVTHNPDLADRYATRIIRLLDGRVVADSDPFDGAGEVMLERAKEKQRKPSLKRRTALALSMNNLLTKKARTILVSFAGSIGIIGIALILSLSTGVQNYISGVERDALSSYPIQIQDEAVDATSLMTTLSGKGEALHEGAGGEAGAITSSNIMGEMMNMMLSEVTTNDLALFKEYLTSAPEIETLVSDISYAYDTDLCVYRVRDDGTALQVNPSTVMQSMYGMDEATSTAFTTGLYANYQMDVWNELVGDQTLLDSQYEMLAGRWPRSMDELVLIVNENYTVSDLALYALGVKDQTELSGLMQTMMQGGELDTERVTFTYDELLSLTFRMPLAGALYEQDEAGAWIDRSKDADFLASALENAMELKIVGIVRPGEDAVTTSQPGGSIGYLQSLTEYVVAANAETPVVKAQLAEPDRDVFTGLPFEGASFSRDDIDLSQVPAAQRKYIESLTDEELLEMMTKYGFSATASTTYEENLAKLGYATLDDPAAISIYPVDFESKDRIVALIEEYNERMRSEGKEGAVIHYTDYVGLLMSSVTVIVNAITYVLIAFVAISLVVSSIMIGIITYISVLERTREIGVLRAIGASKRDISRVFNAETLIIGFSAGFMGIFITWLLTFPANAIVGNLTSIPRVAILPGTAAAILIAISMFLTFIAGLIPAKLAARKDPVVALRSE